MKHNGVVTRILKTSSSAGGAGAGSAAKARPAVALGTRPVPPRSKEADDIVSVLSDVGVEAEQTPAFASNMERDIAAILARTGGKTRPEPAVTPVVPAPVIAQPQEADRVTVRAPGQEEAAANDAHIHVPPPPRPPPLPAELRDAVTARPPGRPQPPPLPARMDIVSAKPLGEPVRVQVKPPPLPLPLAPRRDVHVDVIDAPAETRREPCGRDAKRDRREPPVEFWTDTSLVESVPPSDPNESLPQRRPAAQPQRTGLALAGQIVVYGTTLDGQTPDLSLPALPPALPPGPAPAPVAAQPAPVVPHPVSPPATAWVQQPTTAATPHKPLRARLQAAALGIAAGIAISMVVTWRPEPQPSPSTYALGAAPEGAAARMAQLHPAAKPGPDKAPQETAAPPAPEPTAQLAATQAATPEGPKSRHSTSASAQAQAKPQATAAAVTPVHGSQATARASAAAPEKPAGKVVSLSGRVTGDDE